MCKDLERSSMRHLEINQVNICSRPGLNWYAACHGENNKIFSLLVSYDF
jgi:hypothetical protein